MDATLTSMTEQHREGTSKPPGSKTTAATLTGATYPSRVRLRNLRLHLQTLPLLRRRVGASEFDLLQLCNELLGPKRQARKQPSPVALT